jgi:hypothetical protein
MDRSNLKRWIVNCKDPFSGEHLNRVKCYNLNFSGKECTDGNDMKVKLPATCNAPIKISEHMLHRSRAFLKQCYDWLEDKFVVLMCTSFIRDMVNGNRVPI